MGLFSFFHGETVPDIAGGTSQIGSQHSVGRFAIDDLSAHCVPAPLREIDREEERMLACEAAAIFTAALKAASLQIMF